MRALLKNAKSEILRAELIGDNDLSTWKLPFGMEKRVSIWRAVRGLLLHIAEGADPEVSCSLRLGFCGVADIELARGRLDQE
jgi:hypothetical protein